MTAASGSTNMAMTTTNRACLTLNMTGYTATFNFNTFSLTIGGNTTLCAGCTLSGSAGTLIVNISANLTSNGKALPAGVALTLNGAGKTFTLIDDWTVGGLCTYGGAGQTDTINGAFTLNCNGGLAIATTTGTLSGTASIKLGGTGTLSTAISSGSMRNNLEIASGTITMSGTPLNYRDGVFKCSGGTIVPGTTVLTLTAAATINGACNLYSISVTGGSQAFTGSGWTTTIFSSLVAGLAHTLTDSSTYTVTDQFLLVGTAASHASLTAPTSANLAFTGSTQVVLYTDVINVPATGNAMFEYGGAAPSGSTGWTALTTLSGGSSRGFIIGGN